jgi:hypothetical protein
MSRLSNEDHEWNKQHEASKASGFAIASQQRRFVRVSLNVPSEYPRNSFPRQLDLPRAMSDDEAYAWLESIAHSKNNVRGFYCNQGFYHEVSR